MSLHKIYELSDLTNPIKNRIKKTPILLSVGYLNIKKIAIERDTKKLNSATYSAWLKLTAKDRESASHINFRHIFLGLEKLSFIFQKKEIIEERKKEALELLRFLGLNRQIQEEFSPWLEKNWAYEFNVEVPIHTIEFVNNSYGAIINESGEIFYPGNKSPEEYGAYSDFLCESLRSSMKEYLNKRGATGDNSYPIEKAENILKLIEGKTAILKEKFKLENVLALKPSINVGANDAVKRQKI